MLNLILNNDLSIAQRIDRVGRLQGQIRVLEAQLKKQKAELLEALQAEDKTRDSGELFACTVVDKDVPRVDWKTVAAKFKPSRQLVSAHTKVSHQTYPVVTARKVP